MPSLPSEKFSVLVVDDDPSVRLTLGDILEMHGFHVLVADTGEAAVDVLSNTEDLPGLALLDLKLPDMDGLELTDILRKQHPALQVVILTGHASLDSALSAMRNNTADYLIKPVAPPDLINAVEQGRDRWKSSQVEAAILGSLERFRAVIENLSELVTVIEPAGSIVYESPTVKRLFGYDVSSRLGQNYDKFVHPDDQHFVTQCIADAKNGERGARCTIRVRHSDGAWKSVEMSASCVVKEAPIEGLVLTSRDVTERLRLESQLRQAQKMEAIGQLTGSIAHELNNLLAVVSANSESALSQLPPGSEIYVDIADAHGAARHGARLIQKLLGFSRRERLCAQPTDLVEITHRTAKRIQKTLPETIAIRVTDGPKEGVALADPDAIEQIIINLVNNSRDAMPDGGDVTISVDHVHLDRDFVAQHPGASRGKHICVTVRDNGVGMESEIVDRIFEPFFSTKSISDGTGLGMAMVYGLVKQQRGYVQVGSELGKGTTINVYLPATTERPRTNSKLQATAPDVEKKDYTILVVEDQPKLRQASQRVLERLGYNVVTATDGENALRYLESGPVTVDLMLADVVMPKMGGLELHEALEKKGVHVPTLFMSGFSAQDVREGNTLGAEFRLLQKPWTVDEMACAVKSALGAATQPCY